MNMVIFALWLAEFLGFVIPLILMLLFERRR